LECIVLLSSGLDYFRWDWRARHLPPIWRSGLCLQPPSRLPGPVGYVGGHLGGVVSQDRTVSALGNTNNFGSTGFVGGGQIGCDYQFASDWVVGVEGRAAWSSLSNSHPASVRFPLIGAVVPSQFTLGNDFLASATARLGYSFAPRWLVFARGGGAWTREKIDDAFTLPLIGGAVDPGATMTRSGWTAGAGVEWAFAPHWSTSVEYNYYDFGSSGALLTSPATTVSVNSLKDTIHAVTAGVNYRF
jgi:outer membrane immunogenic protein